MNRAKASLNWTNVLSWLSGTNACIEAVSWVQDKMADLQKVKEDIEKVGKYNMNSSIFALEQFLAEKKYQWAHWFIDRLLTDAEEIMYIHTGSQKILRSNKWKTLTFQRSLFHSGLTAG